MAETMNHWERIQAALKGADVDRAPVSLWRHFPGEDTTAAGLAKVMVDWQRKYDFDFVKYMPTGMYGVHDWGAQTEYGPGFGGARILVKPGLDDPNQWPKLPKLDVTQGDYGQELESIRLAAGELKGTVPIFQTIFSPSTTAIKLRGPQAVEDMRRHPELIKAGLEIITEVTIAFALAVVRAGADGVFFATQGATSHVMTEAEYKEFGVPYDVRVLEAVRNEGKLNLIHVHGDDVYWDLAATYPVDMINWHDRTTFPNLTQAKDRFKGVLVGGLERTEMAEGTSEQVRAQARDAIAQTGGRRIVVAPSCVIPTNTPDQNIRAVIEEVKAAPVAK
jgi:uroporphyrinogen decarboxylase